MKTHLLFTFINSNWKPHGGAFVTNHVTNLYIYTM